MCEVNSVGGRIQQMESPSIMCLDGSHCPTFTVFTQATGHWCWAWATWEQPTRFWTVASCSLCLRQTCKRCMMILSLVSKDPLNHHSVKIFVDKCPNFMWMFLNICHKNISYGQLSGKLPVIRSFGHLVIWSFGHWVIQSFSQSA